MKRSIYNRLFYTLAIAALLLSAAAHVRTSAQAGQPAAKQAYMPVVGGQALPPIDEEPTEVLDCACGFATAAQAPDGTIYVMVQEHDRGGLLYIYTDDLTTFRPVEQLPPVGAAAAGPAPSFGLPSEKNGLGGMLVLSDRLVVWAPARPLGVEEGDYHLFRYQFSRDRLRSAP